MPGAVLLETILRSTTNISSNRTETETKRTKTESDVKHTTSDYCWLYLVQLYGMAGDEDKMLGIYERELSDGHLQFLQTDLKRAISSEMSGAYGNAIKLFDNAMKEMSDKIAKNKSDDHGLSQEYHKLWDEEVRRCSRRQTNWGEFYSHYAARPEDALVQIFSESNQHHKSNLFDDYFLW